MDDFDPRQIISRVRSGQMEAYSELVRHFQGQIRRIAQFTLRDGGEVEDLVQQTFVKAYLNLDKYDAEQDFGRWLRTIARNLLRNELRRSSRESRRMRSYYEHLLVRSANQERSDDYEQELRQALLRCREELGPIADKALRMRYEEQKNFTEIASLLGRTVAAARQMLTRVRGELRKCIEKRMAHEHQ